MCLQSSFDKIPITEERSITSLNLYSGKQKYFWVHYLADDEYVGKTSLVFRPSDNEVRSIGIVNRAEFHRFILDACHAYIFDLKIRSSPIKPNEWMKVQIHNLMKDIGIYLNKVMIK